jgi:hypothetical protein
MRSALILVAATFGLFGPGVGTAQGPAPSVLWQRPRVVLTSTRLDALRYQAAARDHRWEGMAIGAGAGALGFVLLGAALCGQSEGSEGDNCTLTLVRAGLLGAVVGGITGGLIGGAIPKEAAADSSGASGSAAE